MYTELEKFLAAHEHSERHAKVGHHRHNSVQSCRCLFYIMEGVGLPPGVQEQAADRPK